uniref:Signal peptidase complex subunit 1 n=1 Tax=Pyramimonas obovata TaxID=1411642 RepID=A0A7S0N199_9CHLO|mmetsp:Transcript_1661/g.3348  ORF Transcript_1661/g.3348 Transcript_1661/m.3348 type:complete len:102 (+) Transcript_1661:188-493(+)
MDFKGQKLSEIFYQFTVVIFAIISFLLGYIFGSFRLMMLTYGAGVALAFVISVPDWPYFNQHPLTFLSVSSRPDDFFAPKTEKQSTPVKPAPAKKKSKRAA